MASEDLSAQIDWYREPSTELERRMRALLLSEILAEYEANIVTGPQYAAMARLSAQRALMDLGVEVSAFTFMKAAQTLASDAMQTVSLLTARTEELSALASRVRAEKRIQDAKNRLQG